MRLELNDQALYTDPLNEGTSDSKYWDLSARIKPALTTSSLLWYHPSTIEAEYFGCYVDIGESQEGISQLSMREIDQKGGLPSIFTGLLGPSYLLLNVTAATAAIEETILTANSSNSTVVPPIKPVTESDRNEWLDLFFASDNSIILSATLCFPSFDVQDLGILAESSTIRTEPLPGYRNSYTYDDIRRQFGQTQAGNFVYGNAEARDPLKLQPRPWHEQPGDLFDVTPTPTLDDLEDGKYANSWISRGFSLNGWSCTSYDELLNQTAPLNVFAMPPGYTRPNIVFVDLSYYALAQEIINSGSDMAHMLQSLFTVTASSAYYDSLPEFTINTTVTHASFEQVLVPGRYRGYIALLCIIAAHILLCIVTTVWFLTSAKVSSISNAYQTITQVVSDEGLWDIMQNGSMATDKEMRGALARSHRSRDGVDLLPDDTVSVQADEAGTGVRVILRKKITRHS